MADFRQGEGQTKRIHALGPTTREDGTPLEIGEIDHYLRFITYTPPGGQEGSAVEQAVALVEDANTPEYDGEFDETLDIDSQEPGLYKIWYKTVDTGGRESRGSAIYEMNILPPLAAPNPPTELDAV